jgi:hypothetical protein
MSQPTEDLPWVYDPKTKHVYQGFPFDGLDVLALGDDGQPVLPPAAKAAITKADKEATK